MPDRRPPRWRDVRPGLLILAAITVAALSIFFLDEARRTLEEGPRLVVLTPEAPGLQPGSPVWIGGKPMGRVLSVHFGRPRRGGPGEVVLTAVLSRGARDVLRADAGATVEPSGLLAPMVLSLDPGSQAAPPYDFSDTLRGAYTGVEPEEVMALADSLGQVLESLRPLRDDLSRMVEESEGTYGALRRDPALLTELGIELERTADLLDSVFSGRGSAGLLMRDTALAARLSRVLARADSLAEAPGVAVTRRAGLELVAVTDSLWRTLAAFDTLLSAGRGTAGRLLADTALQRELGLLRARLDSLRDELPSQALRHLRFRLF